MEPLVPRLIRQEIRERLSRPTPSHAKLQLDESRTDATTFTRSFCSFTTRERNLVRCNSLSNLGQRHRADQRHTVGAWMHVLSRDLGRTSAGPPVQITENANFPI
jgi:hypothetical protein